MEYPRFLYRELEKLERIAFTVIALQLFIYSTNAFQAPQAFCLFCDTAANIK